MLDCGFDGLITPTVATTNIDADFDPTKESPIAGHFRSLCRIVDDLALQADELNAADQYSGEARGERCLDRNPPV
jgi:hypothetical protein